MYWPSSREHHYVHHTNVYLAPFSHILIHSYTSHSHSHSHSRMHITHSYCMHSTPQHNTAKYISIYAMQLIVQLTICCYAAAWHFRYVVFARFSLLQHPKFTLIHLQSSTIFVVLFKNFCSVSIVHAQ